MLLPTKFFIIIVKDVWGTSYFSIVINTILQVAALFKTFLFLLRIIHHRMIYQIMISLIASLVKYDIHMRSFLLNLIWRFWRCWYRWMLYSMLLLVVDQVTLSDTSNQLPSINMAYNVGLILRYLNPGLRWVSMN